MYIFRWWFPPGNLSSYHLRARCLYHLVVFLGSRPLKCSAPRCLLPLIGLFRACLRPQDSLPPGLRILLRFPLYVRVVFGFFVAFCWRLEDVHETNELKDIYWKCKFQAKKMLSWKSILAYWMQKTLWCLNKCCNDCLIHNNAIQEFSCWIANSMLKI